MKKISNGVKLLVVANWKMNPNTLKEAKQLFNRVKTGIKNVKNVEVVICPPFPYILNLKSEILNLKFGAQDCFWQEKGAFTGEVSPAMLKDLEVEYVIVGHSERRRNLKETDEMVNKKLRAALMADLKPILCVGSEDRDQKKEFKKIKIQLERDLSEIKKSNLKNLIIAYEPAWAVSTTKGSTIATPKQVREGAFFIRKILTELFDKNSAKKIRIIYGGSVDSSNIQDFLKKAKMAGVLVGAASLKPNEFIRTIKAVN
jgi:triosephosphate isomerase